MKNKLTIILPRVCACPPGPAGLTAADTKFGLAAGNRIRDQVARPIPTVTNLCDPIP